MIKFDRDRWEIRSKVWVEKDGKTIIGEGRMAILQAIESLGSIAEAAKETGISYRRIRGAIQEMEKAIGKPLVQTVRGGRLGGGATLTPDGYEMVQRFKRVMEGSRETVDSRFRDIFS